MKQSKTGCRRQVKGLRAAVATMVVAGMLGHAGCHSWAELEGAGVSSIGVPEQPEGAVDSSSGRHQQVLEMRPVGYWPVDTAEGDVLPDLSDTRNPGVIHHVPWDKERNLLDFTGAYQWLEIPRHEAYQTPAFSMGGWVFLRSEVIGGDWVNRQGMLLIGHRHWLNGIGVQLCIRRQEVIDVVSDGKFDVLGTRLYASYKDGKRVERAYGEPSLAIGQWHHLLYTFEPDKDLGGPPASPNLALAATVTASNDGGHHSRAPKNVIDGNPDTHWVVWPGAGPEPDAQKWIQIDFAQETAINRIRLANRPGGTDYFQAGKLHFSDGSVIDVLGIGDDWDGMFLKKQARWVRFEATESQGFRPGLTAFEVYEEDIVIYGELGVVTNLRSDQGVSGTGRLYLNGGLIAEKENIAYNKVNANLQIGNDAFWWHQQTTKSGSLDGSVRDMVWFARSLSAEEAARLHAISQPEVQPNPLYGDDRVVSQGQSTAVADLAGLAPTERRAVLRLFADKDAAILQRFSDPLLPVLTASLDEPECRLPAARVLLKLGNPAARDALRTALPKLAAAAQDEARPEKERAEAVLALAAIGQGADETVPALTAILVKRVGQIEPRLPRIEDVLGNALIRALLDIAPNDPAARATLGAAFAKPLLAAVDLTKPEFREVKELVAQDRQMDGLDVFRKLPLEKIGEHFFSYRPPSDRDYTATAHHDGFTYKVGEGVAWKGVEKVPVEEYTAIVAELAKEHPDANAWRDPEYEHLYRVTVTKIGADGKEQKVYLEGRDFILDGFDTKLQGWSIFVDELGYIHLMGGQHNRPNPLAYIPGSWEKMGVSRDPRSDDYPLQMYWVSREPGNIESFQFAGQRSNPQAIPASYLNYMVMVQSPRKETFLYGRADAFGWQCWGMFRYNAAVKRWTPVGGDPYDLIESARRHNPEWIDFLHDPVRGTLPDIPSDIRRVAWAWRPPFYDFCRDPWGAKFDKTSRLHVRKAVSGLDGHGYHSFTKVYAWSDDRGETFHRADGSPVRLPLTVNPAPEHNAEINTNDTQQWWALWISLLQTAGYRVSY